MRLKFSLLGGLLVLLLIGVGYLEWQNLHFRSVNKLVDPRGKEKPYDKYSFERLVSREDKPSEIEVKDNMFYYASEGRRISGQINQPTRTVPVGIIVMARGYVEKEGYKTGTGTKNAAAYYAKNGYATYAPDFSGYGESDPEDPNALGARLVKPVEILDLIASIKTDKPMYLWGHSNGGQIMLTVAEVLGKRSLQGQALKAGGLTLWAPVSKPFPYNILYYTDEADDRGKWLRGQVSEFEKDYDVFEYSIDRSIDEIKMPVQIHQGSADEAVPKKWSDELAKALREKDKIVNYYIYPGADHNLRPSWDQVVERDVEWFNQLTREEK